MRSDQGARDHDEVREGESAPRYCSEGSVRGSVMLPGRVLRVSDRSARRTVRVGGRGAVRGRPGQNAGGSDVGTRTPPWERCAVRCPQPRRGGRHPPAGGAGRVAADALRGRTPDARGRRVVVAALGRAVLGGEAVLPRLRPGEVRLAVHPRLAVLVRRRPRSGSHLVDVGPGRGPARPRRRCDRRRSRPAPRRGRAAHLRRPVGARRPGHHDRQGRGIRRDSPGLGPAGSSCRTGGAGPR